MKDEKAIAIRVAYYGKDDSRAYDVDEIRMMQEYANQHNEVSESNSGKTSESIDAPTFQPTESPTEKTVEERALELYPVEKTKVVGDYDVNEKLREAYIKGYQRRCLEELTEMGETDSELIGINFWKRLEMFVSDVSVADPMSEEEKDMILNVCKQQTLKQDK